MSTTNYWGNKIYIQSATVFKNSGLKKTQSGKEFCTITIALGQGKDADGKYKPSKFYNMIGNDEMAAQLSYLVKGDRVYVEGKLSYSEYIDQNGAKRGSDTIWAQKVELVSKP